MGIGGGGGGGGADMLLLPIGGGGGGMDIPPMLWINRTNSGKRKGGDVSSVTQNTCLLCTISQEKQTTIDTMQNARIKAKQNKATPNQRNNIRFCSTLFSINWFHHVSLTPMTSWVVAVVAAFLPWRSSPSWAGVAEAASRRIGSGAVALVDGGIRLHRNFRGRSVRSLLCFHHPSGGLWTGVAAGAFRAGHHPCCPCGGSWHGYCFRCSGSRPA